MHIPRYRRNKMATQAQIRARRKGMTQAEMLADMSPSELRTNIRRNGIAAIAEQARRDNYFRIAAGRDDFERGCIIESTQPDWRIS